MNIDLKTILTASNTEAGKTRSKRLIDAGIAASTEHVEKIRKEKRNIEESIEDLMDFSGTTDINAGVKSITNAEMTTKISKLHELMLDLELCKSKLEVAEATHAQLAGTAKED